MKRTICSRTKMSVDRRGEPATIGCLCSPYVTSSGCPSACRHDGLDPHDEDDLQREEHDQDEQTIKDIRLTVGSIPTPPAPQTRDFLAEAAGAIFIATPGAPCGHA